MKIYIISVVLIGAVLFFWFVPVKYTVSINCGINPQANLNWDCKSYNGVTLKDLSIYLWNTLYGDQEFHDRRARDKMRN